MCPRPTPKRNWKPRADFDLPGTTEQWKRIRDVAGTVKGTPLSEKEWAHLAGYIVFACRFYAETMDRKSGPTRGELLAELSEFRNLARRLDDYLSGLSSPATMLLRLSFTALSPPNHVYDASTDHLIFHDNKEGAPSLERSADGLRDLLASAERTVARVKKTDAPIPGEKGILGAGALENFVIVLAYGFRRHLGKVPTCYPDRTTGEFTGNFLHFAEVCGDVVQEAHRPAFGKRVQNSLRIWRARQQADFVVKVSYRAPRKKKVGK